MRNVTGRNGGMVLVLLAALAWSGCTQAPLYTDPRSLPPVRQQLSPAVFTLESLQEKLELVEGTGRAEAALARLGDAVVMAIKMTSDTEAASTPAQSRADALLLMFILDGKAIAILGDTRYAVGPGSVVMVPPGTRYSFKAEEAGLTAISVSVGKARLQTQREAE